MEIGKKFAEFAAGLKFEDLPEEVVEKAKDLFVDFAGLAYRGAEVESSTAVCNVMKKLSTGEAVVIGSGLRVGPEYACLANGCFSHSLELDDVINEASLHPGVVVFPAALAAGEMTKASGKDFITAVVIGYEIMSRLGRAIHPSEHYRRGFHPTGTCGVFAAAAAAARLFQLNREQFLAAMGIAASQAAASMEFLTDGAWTKRFHPGWSAHSGLIAALLARENFKGPLQGIEGRYGFLRSYSERPVPELALEGLGEFYYISKTSLKPHACCRYNQSPIDAVLRIVDENKLSSQQVEKVKVGVVNTAMQIVGNPLHTKRNPQNVVEAQFSLPYAAAISIIRRRAFLEEYDPEWIKSAQVKDLMEKVECYADEALEKEFPQKWPCQVELHTVEGKVYRCKIDYPKGDPQNPLSREELLQKFELLTEKMEKARRKEFLRQAFSLEKCTNIKSLAELLAESS